MPEPGQVQQGSGEGSGEGLGGFDAEPGQVQQGFGEGSGEGCGKLWYRARSGRFRRRFQEALVQSQDKPGQVQLVLEKVPEKVWEALVQSQVRFNRVSEKVPEKVWEALVQSQVRFNRVLEKVLEKVPEKVPGSLGAKPSQV